MSNAIPPSNRSLDAQIAAEILGVAYDWLHDDFYRPDPEDVLAYIPCPHYSSNIAAAFALEEQLAQMGLEESYAYALVQLVLQGSAFGFLHRGAYEHDIFQIAHASPEQRCHAALHAIQRTSESSDA